MRSLSNSAFMASTALVMSDSISFSCTLGPSPSPSPADFAADSDDFPPLPAQGQKTWAHTECDASVWGEASVCSHWVIGKCSTGRARIRRRMGAFIGIQPARRQNDRVHNSATERERGAGWGASATCPQYQEMQMRLGAHASVRVRVRNTDWPDADARNTAHHHTLLRHPSVRNDEWSSRRCREWPGCDSSLASCAGEMRHCSAFERRGRTGIGSQSLAQSPER